MPIPLDVAGKQLLAQGVTRIDQGSRDVIDAVLGSMKHNGRNEVLFEMPSGGKYVASGHMDVRGIVPGDRVTLSTGVSGQVLQVDHEVKVRSFPKLANAWSNFKWFLGDVMSS